MSPLLLGLLGVATVAAAVLGGRTVARRRYARRAEASMRRRLAEAYPAVEVVSETLPLRGPSGRVAVDAAGLLIQLGADAPASELRRVPWSALRQVLPVDGGRVAVHVAHVGEVLVPGALGRQLWEGTGQARTARKGPAERPRADRV